MTFHVAYDFLIFFVMIAAAWGYGTALFRILHLSKTPCCQAILSITAGMGILAHLTLGFGAFLPLSPSLTWILLGIGGILFLMNLVHGKQLLPRINLPHFDLIEILLIVFIIINILFPLVRNTLLPPTTYDEVAYHLAIPKIYIQESRISYISTIPYSNWPLETEMLFLLGLLVGSEILPHLITWGAMIFLCLGLVTFGKHFFSMKAGLIAAAIFSATPMVTSLAGTGMVELPLTLFTFLAFATFFLWVEERQSRFWRMSAIFIGLAASTKLDAAVIAVMIGALLLTVGLFRKEGIKLSLFRFIGFGFISLSVTSVWYLKSWIQTGDPFFSFFLNIFPIQNWDALGTSYLLSFIQKPNLPLTPINYFYTFWLISVNYAKIGPLTFRLGWSYLAGIPLVGVALWRSGDKYRQLIAGLMVISILLFTSWFFQTHQARFFMPAIPLLALAIGAAVFQFTDKILPVIRWAIYSIVITVVILNSWINQPSEISLVRSNKAYLLGRQSREQYLSTHTNVFDVYAYANKNLPSNAFVLLALWENRGYYLDRPYIWLNPISQREIKLEQYRDDNKLAADLAKMGFTYIIYNTSFTDQYLYIQYGPHYAQLIRQLLTDHAQLLFQSGILELYKFIPPTNP